MTRDMVGKLIDVLARYAVPPSNLPELKGREAYRLPGSVKVRVVRKVRGEPILRFTITDETLARDGGIIVHEGWDLDSYRRKGPMLWAHDYSMPPIAKAVDIGTEGRAIWADYQFADYPFARLVRDLYLDGFMHDVSVGWDPIKARIIDDPKELAALGHPDREALILFEKSELWEVSAVPVGSNPNAVIAKAASVASGLARSVFGSAWPQNPTPSWWREKFAALKRGLETDGVTTERAEEPTLTPEQLAQRKAVDDVVARITTAIDGLLEIREAVCALTRAAEDDEEDDDTEEHPDDCTCEDCEAAGEGMESAANPTDAETRRTGEGEALMPEQDGYIERLLSEALPRTSSQARATTLDVSVEDALGDSIKLLKGPS